MSVPSTQTSPVTERGSRQDKTRKHHHQTKPRKNKLTRNTPSRKNHPTKSKKTTRKIIWSVAEKRKSAIHGGASRFIYVTLDLPCKRASQVILQTPRTSYSSRQSRVARRRKRKLERSRVVRKSNQKYAPSVGVIALIFLSHHRPSSPLYQKRTPLGSTVSQYRRSQSASDTQP